MNSFGPDMLAQEDGGGWTSLIYVLVVIVLPMLSRLGAKIRERFGRGDKESEALTSTVSPKPRRRPAKPDRDRQLVGPDVVFTAKPVPTPSIPQARPSRSQPQVVPPPPARPLKAQIAAMLSEESKVRSRRPEKEQKRSTGIRVRPLRRPAKATPPTLILPKIITAKDLRAAVILSEILRPPLALREPDES